MKELLFGGYGRLGTTTLHLYPDIQVAPVSLNIVDKRKVEAYLSKSDASIVYNCAAYTNVDKCEKEDKAKCWSTNVYGVKNLVDACNSLGIHLVQVSSNYAANPVNEYSWTKKAAEGLVTDNGLVIRTALYGIDYFIIQKLLYSKENIKAFNDNSFNPISYGNFAKELVQQGRKRRKGLVNIGTNNLISTYDFAKTFASIFNIPTSRIKATPFKNGKVRRAKHLFITPDNNLTLQEDITSFKEALGGFEHY